MDNNNINDKIRMKQLQIQIEKDPTRKSELNQQLRKLQVQRDKEAIKPKNEQRSR